MIVSQRGGAIYPPHHLWPGGMTMARFKFSAQVTISLWTEVEANSAEEAIAMVEEFQPCDIHESTYKTEVPCDEWHTSGELDGTPVNITMDES